MKSIAMVGILLSAFLFTICPIHAYVYYVEAENFDPDNSKPSVAGCEWITVEDKVVFNKSYILYSGPHTGANTILLYPIPNVSDSNAPWYIWIRCIMPDTGADSYFIYVSNDSGNKWGPQQTIAGGAIWQDWQWKGWTLTTPLEKGNGNVLRVSERENAKADVICIRNDGMSSTDEEYTKWIDEHKKIKIAVESIHKLTTTWGKTKSAY